MRTPTIVSPAFLTIAGTGFAATIAQILVLRELLALFYGNEISTGLIFACWLLWTALGSGVASRWSSRFSASTSTLSICLIVLAAVLPVAIFLIRAARVIWSIPLGELPTIGQIVFITVTVTALICPLSGALFGFCWSFQRRWKKEPQAGQPLEIYLGEALGAALGGLTFYYALLPFFLPLSISLITGVMLLLISVLVLRPWDRFSRKVGICLIWCSVSLLVLLSIVFRSDLVEKSRHLQWGPNLVAVHETPYHTITVLETDRLHSVLINGLWLFSAPDKLSAEHAVHYGMLQHPQPRRVLLIGGGIAGHIEELLKYPEIQRIDYVEPDPDLIPFVTQFLPPDVGKFLHHDAVNLIHEDATTYVRRSGEPYDVILMNIGDPINAEMNRFYTTEFFQQIRDRLSSGGIFSFAVSGGEEMMGHVQARFLSSIRNTLKQTFPNVLIYPGSRSRFFATDAAGELISDVERLTDRIAERQIALSYIREDSLMDVLNPFRLDYLHQLLSEFEDTAINRDFSPICYFQSLMLWAFQWNPRLERFFSSLAAIPPARLWVGMIIAGIVCLGIFWLGPVKFKAAIALSVMVSGAMEMVIQLLLLLAFQVFEGFVYLQLALIIAFYMAGLGIGTATISWWEHRRPAKDFPISYFIRTQTLFSVFPLLLILVFISIHGEFRDSVSSTAMGWLFSGLSLTGGFLGGSHFSLGVLSYVAFGTRTEKVGGTLYALDLLGAVGGVLIASFFIMPVYGLINTLVLLSVISFISLLILLRHP